MTSRVVNEISGGYAQDLKKISDKICKKKQLSGKSGTELRPEGCIDVERQLETNIS